ncbi:MAG: hypothetical protein HRU72_02205 [Planctomycetia bacterium]|uniref:Uncharacterized protein n=2 Tax=Candidatus Brocadia sapporoensis TaxID=392547 RepID=A0A1V6M3E7_9BACT|nr:hypothetical protein [Candidatus Brocadia sp.]OQD46942.1 hypothetical protein BIY37_00600 [Candidatus Brocadia sapporoensis]QOJ07852.1 MAG: hypothetical protein HRU72_02205 [Planctomycetia bacterium]TVL98105.1 MAG: hypothetical protein CV082_01565 [Candidatus Brocadia sp. BL1]HQU30657.1 hypothetical protein [Candidatus Brocadia sapporoensis]
MPWNYRVIEDKGKFRIHEVYYNDAGEITAISEDPIAPEGETLEELKDALEYYFAALKRPVLKKDEIKFASMIEDD